MSFHVHKVYYRAHDDLLVLAGVSHAPSLERGWWVDLPEEIKGPGWVPIADVQVVTFGDEELTCVILSYDVIAPAPLMEFHDLEGLVLRVRPTALS